MEFDSNWQERYARMVRTPQQAVKEVRSGQRVFIGTGCGEPTELVKALTARGGELSDVEIVQLFTKGDASYAQKKYADCFRVNSFFIGQNVRDMIREGLGNYTPILLSNIPHLFNSGLLPLDVALIQITPPNAHGKVSLGISVDIVKSAVENASLIIAQVNPQMPWTLGDSIIDIYDIDILVPAEVPLIEREDEPVHEISRMIGRHISTLVPDGATVQFGLGRMQGLGRIPHATMEFLKDKKDLGIHSEMITDSILGLIRAGVVNGSRKSSDRGRIVTSFCMGTRELYDAVNDNPLFCFRPTEYVNDARVISQQTRMVAINMAQEIDLTGQICSDSQAGMLYSGIGGLVDFNRGATTCKDGKSIVALPSTNLDGSRSNIMAQLSPGSGVSITRGAVSYVVTEYGVAYLYGKSLQDRVMALIAIAHPNFREQLFRDAIEARYLPPDMARVGDKIVLPTDETMRTVLLLEDGTQLTIRSIQPTDEPLMRDLVYTLSRETIYYRFMSSQVNFSHRQIQDFVYVDHRKDVAIVGTIPEAHGEDIIAVGRYYLDEKTNRAEVAFVVRDDWQGKRIGSFLFKHLTDLAKRNGIAGFTAEVLRDNIRMQTIFNHSGHKVQTRLVEGVYSFVIDF
jgi:acyl-CoA hydrolase/GNAT superfamily N-acetyltransferase